jgi:RNA polymerase sigma factor (sigma-70 family)
MRESSNANTEGDFVVLLKRLLNGQLSVDDFLLAVGFEDWLRVCVYSRGDYQCFDGSFGAEDLRQLCRQKVREAAPRLKPENTPNKSAFCGWVRMLVRNTYLDQLRKHQRPQKNGLSRTYALEEIIDIRTPDIAYERKELYRRFMTFIKDYPEAHRLAVALWLQEESLRDIAEALNERGIECSHVTVSHWVNDLLHTFKVRLGLEPPRPPRRRRD